MSDKLDEGKKLENGVESQKKSSSSSQSKTDNVKDKTVNELYKNLKN